MCWKGPQRPSSATPAVDRDTSHCPGVSRPSCPGTLPASPGALLPAGARGRAVPSPEQGLSLRAGFVRGRHCHLVTSSVTRRGCPGPALQALCRQDSRVLPTRGKYHSLPKNLQIGQALRLEKALRGSWIPTVRAAAARSPLTRPQVLHPGTDWHLFHTLE